MNFKLNKKTSRTLWGTSETLEIKYFDLVEKQHPSPRRASKSITATIWALSPEDATERRERQDLLRSTCFDSRAIACVLSLTAHFLNHPEAEARTLSLLQTWDIASSCPLYFDSGKLGPPAWLPLKHCVSDPLWFGGEISGSYWKIHGWHETRWVRKYSEAALKNLLRTARCHLPLWVVLAHSQRAQQLNTIYQLSPDLDKDPAESLSSFYTDPNPN